MASEHSGEGTRQRVIACRRRLREARAAQRSAPHEVEAGDCAPAGELLENSVDDAGLADFADGLRVTETSARQPARSFVPSVDRRAPVRAR